MLLKEATHSAEENMSIYIYLYRNIQKFYHSHPQRVPVNKERSPSRPDDKQVRMDDDGRVLASGRLVLEVEDQGGGGGGVSHQQLGHVLQPQLLKAGQDKLILHIFKG